MFFINATLAWIVVACAVLIMLIILAFLAPLRRRFQRVVEAETWKSAALGETVVGIKTVKALGLEPQRKALWDERVAEAGKARLAFGQLANWPQTLVTPIERVMVLGTMLIGAYLAMNDTYRLYGRRAVRLHDAGAARGAAARRAGAAGRRLRGGRCSDRRGGIGAQSAAGKHVRQSVGLRPKLVGEITFSDLTFSYIGTKTPALDRVNLQHSGRNHVRHRRAQRLGKIDDRAAAAGDQPRL